MSSSSKPRMLTGGSVNTFKPPGTGSPLDSLDRESATRFCSRAIYYDKKYIDSITDSSYWASAYALRRLFAMLFTSSSISRLEVVWNADWEFLAEDAQFQHRRLMQNPSGAGRNECIEVIIVRNMIESRKIERSRLLGGWPDELEGRLIDQGSRLYGQTSWKED
nr:uncharacterized protein LOC109193512 [Ipomoea batatas]GMC64751.1 uncharacterized protein LOC109193512 [Ipomoea batatas]